jgi:hypothetical protein
MAQTLKICSSSLSTIAIISLESSAVFSLWRLGSRQIRAEVETLTPPVSHNLLAALEMCAGIGRASRDAHLMRLLVRFVLIVERFTQALEVRIKGDKAIPLKEGSSARLIRQAIERALTE